MAEYWIKDILSSLFALIMVGGGIYLLIRMNKNELWKKSFKSIWAVRSARISFIILSVFILIFLLDSITYPKFKTVNKKQVYIKSITLLDVIYNPVREESYSAPFSRYQLEDKTVKNNAVHIGGSNINGED